MNNIPIEIKYEGKDVQNGSMPIHQLVGALNGFANAYANLVIYKKSEYKHNLRVTGIEKGSVVITLEVIQEIIKTQTQPEIFSISSVILIVGTILEIIKLTRHTKNKPYKTTISGDGNLTIQNCDKVSLTFNKETVDIYNDGLIKQDIGKISDPLEKDKVDNVTISVGNKKDRIKESINEGEKAYFEYSAQETTITKEMKLRGSIISLNKESNRGSFRLQNGKRVSYKLGTNSPENLYPFFIFKGLVEVKCIAHLDENLDPMGIDILDVEEIQKSFKEIKE